MKARLHHLLDQVLKRCPKSGRVVGVRRDTPLARALFPLVSLLAIAWFLLRTMPEPRAHRLPVPESGGRHRGWVHRLARHRAADGDGAAHHPAPRRCRGGGRSGRGGMAFIYYSETSGWPPSPPAVPTAPQVFTAPEGANNRWAKARESSRAGSRGSRILRRPNGTARPATGGRPRTWTGRRGQDVFALASRPHRRQDGGGRLEQTFPSFQPKPRPRRPRLSEGREDHY